MSAESFEASLSLDSQPKLPTIAEFYREAIDIPNAQREARQMSQITSEELCLDDIPYWLTTYMPTDGLRTWRNASGEKIEYPHILMAHGVASDSRYFDSIFRKLNKLGLGCSAISFPREKHIVWDGDELLDWQSAALAQSYEHIHETRNVRKIVLGGHSRGALPSILATQQLMNQSDDYESAGLLFMAPAGLERPSIRRVARAAINLIPLGYNSLRNTDDFRQIGRIGVMLAQNILANPEQTVIEVKQALSLNLSDVLYTELGHVPVLITAAEHDEFIDHQQTMTYAKFAPSANISLASLDTNHLLGERPSSDVISLADPRLLTGQILSWLQSLTDSYHPLAVNVTKQTVSRL